MSRGAARRADGRIERGDAFFDFDRSIYGSKSGLTAARRLVCGANFARGAGGSICRRSRRKSRCAAAKSVLSPFWPSWRWRASLSPPRRSSRPLLFTWRSGSSRAWRAFSPSCSAIRGARPNRRRSKSTASPTIISGRSSSAPLRPSSGASRAWRSASTSPSNSPIPGSTSRHGSISAACGRCTLRR